MVLDMRNVEDPASREHSRGEDAQKPSRRTMQGETVDRDDDQSGKDQSDLFVRDSSESVVSRSRLSVIRKSHSKSRTRNDQPKIVYLKTRSSSEPLNKLGACMTSMTSTTSTQ